MDQDYEQRSISRWRRPEQLLSAQPGPAAGTPPTPSAPAPLLSIVQPQPPQPLPVKPPTQTWVQTTREDNRRARALASSVLDKRGRGQLPRHKQEEKDKHIGYPARKIEKNKKSTTSNVVKSPPIRPSASHRQPSVPRMATNAPSIRQSTHDGQAQVPRVSANAPTIPQSAFGGQALTLRVTAHTPTFRQVTHDGEASAPRVNANPAIRDYVRADIRSNDPSSWLNVREIPTAEEINTHNDEDDTLVLRVNKIDGAWESKEEYLQAHYRLLREDSTGSLREAVYEFECTPTKMEKHSQAFIYDHVHIVGVTLTSREIAFRVTFSLARVGKKIRWNQSNRLKSGTIVALSPTHDMFKSVCKVAIVAARPLEGLERNPPEVDLCFGSFDESEIDPQQEWIMLEARAGYFEAYRHTLTALQRMSQETFPLAEHLVHTHGIVGAPNYLRQKPFRDLSLALDPDEITKYQKVNILTNWPEEPSSVLDASQWKALQRMLTKRCAIVQGPPGTGKTHVSVTALKILLKTLESQDFPIIVAARTNHAVDQLLKHVSLFEPNFIRLGSRTLDVEIIKPQTLFEIKKTKPLPSVSGGSLGQARKKQENIVKELKALLSPLTEDHEVIPAEVFLHYRLITQEQYDSIGKGAAGWLMDSSYEQQVPLTMWLGRELIRANRQPTPDAFGFDFEEPDLDFEQLREFEAETVISDDEFEALNGVFIRLADDFTGRKSTTAVDVEYLLKFQDLWKIPEKHRGLVYSHLQEGAKASLTQEFRKLTHEYANIAQDVKIGRWEIDATYLKSARVIGMTTTGLSKNRGLLASVKPKVVLIEEAAETLEAEITVACFESLEHLILVGDHQQLRAHCSIPDLAMRFNLDVSMFERLVRNEIEYSQLNKQRRMIPEIRRLLSPIYPNLEDHDCVLNRRPVPGMGGVNTFFLSRDWPESDTDTKSKSNTSEAQMTVGFYNYLRDNGMDSNGITVLTFYNGQRKKILHYLQSHPSLEGLNFKVATVDSYQGEENEIVLLSLVRSNFADNIGFLEIDNRVCVALSRARRGFYIIGNGEMISKASKLWENVLSIMSTGDVRVGSRMPIMCKNHKRRTEIQDPLDWNMLHGGCSELCGAMLNCGHPCPLKCHPYDHSKVICHSPCKLTKACGHRCIEPCHVRPCKYDCDCGKTSDRVPLVPSLGAEPDSNRPAKVETTTTRSYDQYSITERQITRPRKHKDGDIIPPDVRRSSPPKENLAPPGPTRIQRARGELLPRQTQVASSSAGSANVMSLVGLEIETPKRRLETGQKQEQEEPKLEEKVGEEETKEAPGSLLGVEGKEDNPPIGPKIDWSKMPSLLD